MYMFCIRVFVHVIMGVFQPGMPPRKDVFSVKVERRKLMVYGLCPVMPFAHTRYQQSIKYHIMPFEAEF